MHCILVSNNKSVCESDCQEYEGQNYPLGHLGKLLKSVDIPIELELDPNDFEDEWYFGSEFHIVSSLDEFIEVLGENYAKASEIEKKYIEEVCSADFFEINYLVCLASGFSPVSSELYVTYQNDSRRIGDEAINYLWIHDSLEYPEFDFTKINFLYNALPKSSIQNVSDINYNIFLAQRTTDTIVYEEYAKYE